MKQLQTYISGIMAGLAIALGGTVYLSVENQIVGALFFHCGLVYGLHDEFSTLHRTRVLSL